LRENNRDTAPKCPYCDRELKQHGESKEGINFWSCGVCGCLVRVGDLRREAKLEV